jgi:membrane-bound ClpP family serine protease
VSLFYGVIFLIGFMWFGVALSGHDWVVTGIMGGVLLVVGVQLERLRDNIRREGPS